MSDRSNQEEVIFEEALKRTSDTERAAYLDEACHGNPELRERLDLLLEGYFKADGFLTRESESHEGDEAIGTLIGRYKPLERIGEGGFGVVYVAEQKEPVKRHVALKILKPGMDTKQIVARFEAERQALALMDHPNIAKVFDGGSIPQGRDRPYFVMELVRGIPITKYCEENQLALGERLELFIQVCQAVQHAHQKGIIHRDLKPSNILVTVNDGVAVPKVIDFGVAKATQQELTEKTIFTQFHHFIGTPAYMSPEQAEMTSVDIDTRSDIYSLGVLLYELLTGKTPFDSKDLLAAGLDEMRRIIREEEPLRPSTRLARERTSRRSTSGYAKTEIDPDLEWIVLKCLEKDRGRRYDTANGVAADVQRYLNHEPVVARPPTVFYRVGKFVRRNRTTSTAVAVVILATLLGIVISTWALFRERTARAQADQRLRSALKFVDEIFKGVAPEIRRVPGAAKAREKLGQASLSVLEDLRANAAQDDTVRDALVKALLYLSETQGNIGEANIVGDYEAGLQRAQEAIALLSSVPVESLRPQQLESLITAHGAAANSLRSLGRYDEAVRALEATDPLLTKLERIPEFGRWANVTRIRNLAATGYFIALAGRPRDALKTYLAPVLNSEWAQGVTTNSAEGDLEMLANTLGQLSCAHLLLQDYDAMTAAAERCVALQEVLTQRFPANVRHVGCLAAARATRGFGLMHKGKGRFGEALASLNQSRQAIEDLVSQEPANEFPRVWRSFIATIQSRSFAIWSMDPSTSPAERQQRLTHAENYLLEAETFVGVLKDAQRSVFLEPARNELAAAREKLATASGQP